MKFSGRQILASAAGAVIAAVIASSFGVTGTIVGVAIGSMAATLGTALVSQSIERGQRAVKQVVVRTPDGSPLLRRLGGTGPTGKAASSVDASSAPKDATAVSEIDEEVGAAASAPATERLEATRWQPARPRRLIPARRRMSWKALAGTAVLVFVLALAFITAVELISGKPLSAIFGGGGSGTTVGHIINPPPPSTTTPSSTTTTTPSSTTTTTTTTSSSTTTTTSSSTTTTTTTPPGGSTTTLPGTATTTTTVGGTTSTTTPTASS